MVMSDADGDGRCRSRNRNSVLSREYSQYTLPGLRYRDGFPMPTGGPTVKGSSLYLCAHGVFHGPIRNFEVGMRSAALNRATLRGASRRTTAQ
eukprot:6212742-Pleurochrysis_carterae.AAC.2